MAYEVPYALPIDGDPPSATVVNELVVADRPAGGISRVFVEVTGDGLATGVRVPVLVARGHHEGPVFGITAALHGNELNGIHVIHRLFASLDVQELRGAVVGVVAANVPGLHRNQRHFTDGVDLNHIFPGREGGTVSQVYANRLLTRIVDQFDYLVDLHTASFGRVNSLYVRADMTHEVTATMAYLQNPQIIVHNPASDYTLRGTAMDRGVPAITVEVGDPQRYQHDFVARTMAGLFRILGHFGLTDTPGCEPDARPVLCSGSAWSYTDRGGLLEVLPELADRLEEGQLVARLRNAFGDAFRKYRAPGPGIVIGKSTNPVSQTGGRILHLGTLGAPDAIVPPPL